MPLGDSYRCVGGRQTRLYTPRQTDAGGSVTSTLDFTRFPLNQLAVGSEVTVQFWFQDQAHGFFPFDMSDNLALTLCP